MGKATIDEEKARKHMEVIKHVEIRQLKGRLRFGKPGIDKPGPAPFPSIIVIYHNEYME